MVFLKVDCDAPPGEKNNVKVNEEKVSGDKKKRGNDVGEGILLVFRFS